jgi:hypothetical protein
VTLRQLVTGWEGGHVDQFNPISGTGAVEAAAARNGGYGLRLNPTAGASSTNIQYAPVPLRSNVGHIDFRYRGSLPAGDCHLVTWDAGGGAPTMKYRLIFQASTGKIQMENFQSVQNEVQDGPVIVGGQWYGLDYGVGRGGAKQIEWQIDGVDQPTVGPDAGYFGGPLFLVLGNSGSQTYDLDFDNFASYDGQNNSPDEPIVDAMYPTRGSRDGYVKRLATTGVGTHVHSGDFGFSSGVVADSWQLLDQLPMLATTDWVSQTVLDATSYLEYTHEDLASGEEPIGVNWWMGGNNAFFNQSNIRLHGVSGATDMALIAGVPADFVPHAARGIPTIWPWTAAEVNALLTRIGYSTDVTPNPQLNSAFIEVDVLLPPPIELGLHGALELNGLVLPVRMQDGARYQEYRVLRPFQERHRPHVIGRKRVPDE